MEIRELLNSRKVAEREKAAKYIGKELCYEFSEELFQAYLNEAKSAKTWNAQSLMIEALGLIGNKNSLEYITRICEKNIEHDYITIRAASAFVRLKRIGMDDATPAIELLEMGNYSVVHGAYITIGYDKMMPSEFQINELLKYANKFKIRTGYSDVRYGLAAAAAGWDQNLVKTFLESCLDSEDEGLKYVAMNSLKGKYVKLR